MPLPEFTSEGLLPPGIYAATLREIEARFGANSEVRQKQMGLLKYVLNSAHAYLAIKRILLWGSFVTSKPEPNDLDYSLVVSVDHRKAQITEEHRRFLVASEARRFYGTDVNYLILYDYPVDYYTEKLDFLCHTRAKQPCGIVEVHIRGEFTGETP